MRLPARADRRVDLSAGPIEYVDVGSGPVIVFGHGVPMTHTQWAAVVPLLSGYRCVLPTLPMGGHRLPMRPGADLSHRGQARLLGEFCAALDLSDVTLVLNDWGGGQFLLREPEAHRIGRLVLVACEAFDNFPPPPARPLAVLARVPGGLRVLTTLMRLRRVRQAKLGYGVLARSGLDDTVLVDWFAPATASAAIRRDFARFAASAPSAEVLLRWADEVASFEGPVLVVWADHDTLMPLDHGPRLARLYADAELVRVADSATLVPIDQPAELARHLRRFLAERGAPASD